MVTYNTVCDIALVRLLVCVCVCIAPEAIDNCSHVMKPE